MRRPALIAAMLAALMILTGLAAPAAAAAEPDDEGGTAAFRDQLAAASRGYLDATAALERSRKRQRELTFELTTIESDLVARTRVVGEIAAVAYRTGRVGTLAALIGADSPETLLDRALALNSVAANENAAVQQLTETRQRAERAKAAIDNEVRQQQQQLAVMAQRKKDAEKVLADAVADEARAQSNVVDPGIPTTGIRLAAAAPRNSDGSWPAQGCSLPDPTTSGCVSPRLLHAYTEARRAGFQRYTSCFRNGSSGEHPKGKACDHAAQVNGFGGTATGGDKTYGNNLAAFYIYNASRLGVLYVIWYRRIWLPSSGWKSYSGCCDPASMHTNHVHLSVY